MEIIEKDDEEVKQLMLRISNKEITLCETCDVFFDYVPQKRFCDECTKTKEREYTQRPEYKAKKREYDQRPENKAKNRERKQRPENKAKDRKRNQRPEYKAKRREYAQRPENKAKALERYQRNKKLREEE